MHVYFNPHLSQYSYSKDYNACTLLVFCFSNLYLIFVIVAVPNHTENSIFSHTTSWLYFCSYVIYIMHYIANNLNKLFVLRTGKVASIFSLMHDSAKAVSGWWKETGMNNSIKLQCIAFQDVYLPL